MIAGAGESVYDTSTINTAVVCTNNAIIKVSDWGAGGECGVWFRVLRKIQKIYRTE